MSDVPEKKDKPATTGLAEKVKSAFKGKEKDEEEKKVVKADVPAKPLEEPPKKMEEPAAPTAAKMVDAGGVTLEEANPGMARKHTTVLNQKSKGARKYFRNRK